jgi:dinuclear metal center YbgI/SA1388 family protein
MAVASLKDIVRYCDRELRVDTIQDYEGAHNGLQVENDGRVRRIAAAVDASLATVKLAIEAGADLLLVHHGLFWGPVIPWTGRKRELLQLLLQHNLAVYSAHLPLDMHPRLGNNAVLARALGWRQTAPFFPWKNQPIGLQTRLHLPREELLQRIQQAVGAPPKLIPGGPQICRRVGLVTGGAGAELKLAAAEGVDTFITGEGPHWTFALAEELQLNVFYAGHYATETFGVKALAQTLSQKFKVPWAFLDHPTGL